MSEPGAIVDAQLRHLLEVVKQHRDERCAEILQQAAEQAGQVITQAHQEARSRMQQAVADARGTLHRQLVSAEARRQTQRRQRRHQADKAQLDDAWPQLRDALARRWQEPANRRHWVDALLAQAAAVLVDPHWLIEHPCDWPTQERAAVEAQLREQCSEEPRFAAQPDITAGLRISASGACVDGSVEGLLRERAAIEAELLAGIHARLDAGV